MHTLTHTHTERLSGKTHRIRKFMFTKKKISERVNRQLRQKAHFLGRGGGKCGLYQNRKGDYKVANKLELGNIDIFVITSYYNLCDQCTVG